MGVVEVGMDWIGDKWGIDRYSVHGKRDVGVTDTSARTELSLGERIDSRLAGRAGALAVFYADMSRAAIVAALPILAGGAAQNAAHWASIAQARVVAAQTVAYQEFSTDQLRAISV